MRVQPCPGKNPNTRLDVDSAGSPHAQEPRRQGDRRATDSPRVSSLKGTRKLTSGVCCYRKGCCTTCETRTKEGNVYTGTCVCARVRVRVFTTCPEHPFAPRINPEMPAPGPAGSPGARPNQQVPGPCSEEHVASGKPLRCVRRSALPVWVQILAPLIFNNVSLGQLS